MIVEYQRDTQSQLRELSIAVRMIITLIFAYPDKRMDLVLDKIFKEYQAEAAPYATNSHVLKA